MKRALAMALGAMMVAGSAAPASAASQIDFSGYFRVYGISATNMGAQTEDLAFTDGYFLNRLVLDMVFRPTDELDVVWQLRAPHGRRWGSAFGNNNQGMGLGSWHLYGVIKQDWGNVALGRVSQGMDQYGLGTLGWTPGTIPIMTYRSAFDNGSPTQDAVRYTNRWDNGFGLLAQYSKLANNGAGVPGQGAPLNTASGQDWDRIMVEGQYFWDGGGASLGVRYDNVQNALTGHGTVGGGILGSTGTNYGGSYNPYGLTAGTPPLPIQGIHKQTAWYLNPAIMHSWGAFSAHFEAQVGWGEQVYDHGVLGLNNSQLQDTDLFGWGAYLDVNYNYGPGNVTFAGWYAAGTNMDESVSVDANGLPNGDINSLVSVNQGNFYPLLVAYHNVGAPAGGARIGSSAAVGTTNGLADGQSDAITIANNAWQNFVRPGYGTTGAMNVVEYVGTSTAGALTLPAIQSWGAAAQILASPFQRTWGASNPNGGANHWALALTGNHAFSDDITMHYALAYLALNKPNYRIMDSANNLIGAGGVPAFDGAAPAWGNFGYTTQSKDLGIEADLGFTFQLLDNLAFTTAFGYMFNGDAYKTLRGYRYTGNVSGTGTPGAADTHAVNAIWDSPEDSYVWTNTLTFSF